MNGQDKKDLNAFEEAVQDVSNREHWEDERCY